MPKGEHALPLHSIEEGEDTGSGRTQAIMRKRASAVVFKGKKSCREEL